MCQLDDKADLKSSCHTPHCIVHSVVLVFLCMDPAVSKVTEMIEVKINVQKEKVGF